MRLMILNTTFLPEWVGGAELHTFWLAREMARRGHTLTVVRAEVQPGLQRLAAVEESYQGLRVVRLRLPPRWPSSQWSARPDVHGWALEELDRFRPDALLFSLFWHLVAVAHAAAERGIPFVLDPMLYSLFCVKHFLVQRNWTLCDGLSGRDKCRACVTLDQSWKQKALAATLEGLPRLQGLSSATPLLAALDGVDEARVENAWLMRHAAAILATTHFVADLHRRNGAPPDKIIRWVHGVPEPARVKRPAGAAETIRFAVISRLSPEKGIDLLIQAVKKIPAARSFRVTIHGTVAVTRFGPYADLLQGMAEGEPRIEFGGPVSNDSLDEVYDGIDVLVVPSNWYEVQGLTVLEALARKTPVIVSDFGGLPEAVEHGRNGLIFKGGDAEDLARVMTQVLDDPACVQRMQTQMGGVRFIADAARELEGILRASAVANRPLTSFSPAVSSGPTPGPGSNQ